MASTVKACYGEPRHETLTCDGEGRQPSNCVRCLVNSLDGHAHKFGGDALTAQLWQKPRMNNGPSDGVLQVEREFEVGPHCPAVELNYGSSFYHDDADSMSVAIQEHGV